MSSPSESAVLVIGIGNLLRGDDGVGRIVAKRLRERNIPGLRVLEQAGETTGLMEAWADADTVFIVDATSSKSRPGTIRRLNATHQSLQRRIFQGSSHSLGLHEAVELARELKRLPGRLIIYGIEGKSYDLGGEVSPQAKEAASRVADRIVAELRRNGSISEITKRRKGVQELRNPAVSREPRARS